MKMYSTKQAATKIGVSWITLQRHVTSGKTTVPPLQKVGGVTVRLWSERDNGLGHLLQAVLKSAPKLRGVLFDQPHVVERVGVDETIANRLVLQGGDFFRGPLPRCDAYVLMEVLHDWTDEQSRQILQQIRKAAPDKAKLLVVETVLPNESAWAEGHGEHFANHLDINMLVLTGGRERTPDEFANLFADCGWQLARVIPTSSPYSIVEAVAA